jgi:hypothetical protein
MAMVYGIQGFNGRESSQGISGVLGLLNLYHYCVMPSWTLEAISVEAESTVQAENNTECGVGKNNSVDRLISVSRIYKEAR